ncbi:MAG: Mur ligase family protein [Erysipelotrichaceae bacterium]|nr:Mur ligase family protein [Erysipelotrichaceae bacterium]
MNRFNKIEQAIEWVSLKRSTFLGIEKFRELLNKNNLKNNFKVIHISGTNGKGSTTNFIKDILYEAGFKVGTLTSPHLIKHQDRIRINGEYISDEDFLKYVNENIHIFEQYQMSMFEIDIFIMLKYFNDNKVDYGIIEVGIGGRLDCTNIFDDTLLSIITTIGFDHMDKLGNTLEEIAFEKSGIIKNDSSVVIGYLNESCKKVIKDVCINNNSKLYFIDEYIDIDDITFKFENEIYQLYDFVDYQKGNACIAIKACKLLDIDNIFIKNAIKKSKWLGRFETLSKKPNIIIDGAHNVEGVMALINSYKKLNKKIGIVFSALKDKEVEEMINLLKNNSEFLIACEFDFYRVKNIDEISIDVIKIKDYKEAIDYGIKKIEDNFLIICGSLYFISEVRNYIKNEFCR